MRGVRGREGKKDGRKKECFYGVHALTYSPVLTPKDIHNAHT